MAFRFAGHRAQAYKNFRDRSAIRLDTKHIRQFDTFDHVTLFSPGRVQELATLGGYRITALKGEISGKRRKIIFQRCLHWTLAHLLPYHLEIWDPSVIYTFEGPA